MANFNKLICQSTHKSILITMIRNNYWCARWRYTPSWNCCQTKFTSTYTFHNSNKVLTFTKYQTSKNYTGWLPKPGEKTEKVTFTYFGYTNMWHRLGERGYYDCSENIEQYGQLLWFKGLTQHKEVSKQHFKIICTHDSFFLGIWPF